MHPNRLSIVRGAIALVLSLPVCGCLDLPPRVAHASWNEGCWPRARADVDRLAGDDATDCGLLGMMDSEAARWSVRRCAERAYASEHAFKVGYHGFSGDSSYCVVAARSNDGTLWVLFADHGIGGADVLSVSRCEGLAFDGAAEGTFFQQVACVEDPSAAAALGQAARASSR